MNGEKSRGFARGIPRPAVAGDPAIEGGPHDHGERGVDEKQDGEGEGHALQPTFARPVVVLHCPPRAYLLQSAVLR